MRLSREFIQNKIKWWEMVLDVWDRCEVKPSDTVEEAACKLFIRTQTTQGLRNALVRHGYKIKYDMRISELITMGTIDDEDLMRVARELFKANKEHSSLR